MRLLLFSLLIVVVGAQAAAATTVAYIHGNVGSDGAIPASGKPFHQMLLSDDGDMGLSTFKALVEAEGFNIDQFYDAETTLTSDFLQNIDVIVFGLHQKIWSVEEKAALNSWLREGGGILIYNDSAAGGHHKNVGLRNLVGQKAINTLLSGSGMQVATDQGGGTRSYFPPKTDAHPMVSGLILEGEGVSPVAVANGSSAKVLIPLDDEHLEKGKKKLRVKDTGITLEDYRWAALAMETVGKGHIAVLFDRQPLWNAGPGSSIQKKDNKEILQRIIRFLAQE